MKKAFSIVHIDNDQVRVTKWVFEPGASTGWHRHNFDYIVTPIIGQTVKIATADGIQTTFKMKTASPYYRQAGVEHDVINGEKGSFVLSKLSLNTGQVDNFCLSTCR